MRFDRHILPVVLLVASLAYTLWFVFAGFGNHQDPLYWLYKYEHLEGGWMAVGSLLTGGAIVRIFGAQLLPLRLFGWLCTVTAIALPYICLLDKQQRKENLHWLAFTYLLMGYGTFQEFSPGTLSVLLLSAIWVCTSNIKHHTSYIAAILLGLAVTARFPNILALLILIPIWKKRALWCIPVAALTAGVVYGVGWLCITPAPMDSAMTSHDLMEMVTGLWENSGKLVLYALMAIGVMAFRHKRFMGLVMGVMLALAVTYTIKPHQWYNIDLTYMLSAMVLVITLSTFHTFRSFSEGDKNFQLSTFNFSQLSTFNSPLPIGALLLMIATLGTDTAWLKLFPAVLCLLPVALAKYETLNEKRFLYELLTVFSAVVIFRMTTNSIGQSNLTKADTLCSVAPYQGIAIRSAEQQRLQQYKADYNWLNDSINRSIVNRPIVHVLALGQECHLMRAVTGCEAAKYNEFWSNIFDTVYTEKYQAVIEREHPIVFCSYSPQFKTKPIYLDQQSALERMLLDHGYTPLDRSKYKYMIYLPAYEQEIR